MAARHCSVKNGSTGSGAKHSDYISGQDKYADKGKEEVVYLASGNMPEFARENPTEFWHAADKFERANYTAEKTNKLTGEKFTKEFKGRAYREIEFSIPREITDPAEQIRFAKEFAEKIVGKNHPHTLAVHNALAKDGKPNVNAHLMFSERVNDGINRTAEKFFSRAASAYRDVKTKQLVPADPAKGGAKKDRDMNAKGFVQGVREKYQAHAKSHGVDLDMRSNKEQWLGQPEPKLGPMHNRSKDNPVREAKQEIINQIRAQRKENEQYATASFNRIGVNLQSASRYGEVANRAITAAGKNHESLEPTSGRIEQAARTFGHSRAAQSVVETVGRITGQIVREITRATEVLASYVKRTEKPLEAIKTIEPVKSIATPERTRTTPQMVIPDRARQGMEKLDREFKEKYEGLPEASSGQEKHGTLVASHGNKAVLHVGRGVHVVKTYPEGKSAKTEFQRSRPLTKGKDFGR